MHHAILAVDDTKDIIADARYAHVITRGERLDFGGQQATGRSHVLLMVIPGTLGAKGGAVVAADLSLVISGALQKFVISSHENSVSGIRLKQALASSIRLKQPWHQASDWNRSRV